jgi:hypothetical protein
MKDPTFSYAVLAITAVLTALLLLSGCSSPQKTLNFFTPDRFGYGIMDGTMNWRGVGEIETIWQSDIGDIYWDLDGEQQTTMIYLEWDLPEWEERNYDRYMRERLRQLNMELAIAQDVIADKGPQFEGCVLPLPDQRHNVPILCGQGEGECGIISCECVCHAD